MEGSLHSLIVTVVHIGTCIVIAGGDDHNLEIVFIRTVAIVETKEKE